jgi:hypothetical protein
MVDGTGFEPAASAMPTLRSFQADLPARDILNPAGKLLSVMGRRESAISRTLTSYLRLENELKLK